MPPEKRVPTHPGEVLLAESLELLGVTRVELAEHIGVPVQRVNGIVRGRRGVRPETAWLSAEAFGTTPESWVDLQASYDLASSKPSRRIRRLRGTG